MFEIRESIPFVFMRLEDDTLLDEVSRLCLAVESDILKLDRAQNWRNLKGNETSARYSNYNFFLFKQPIVKTVYDHIKIAYYEMLEHLNKPRESMFIQCWINIHRAGEGLRKHAHPYPMHGHLTVDCDRTSTVYGNFGELIIPNEKGMMTLLGKPNVMHRVTQHNFEGRPRISVAFDLLPQSWVEGSIHWRLTYENRVFIPFD